MKRFSKVLFTFYFSLFTYLCSGQYNVLLYFNNNNGEFPFGGLTLSGNIMYGTTDGGGAQGERYGNVFSIHTDGSGFKQLWVFTDTNDMEPSNLILVGKTLFGATIGGNYQGYYGTIFSIDSNGNNYKKLHVFNDTIGSQSNSLTYVSGKLYGTAWSGGLYNGGCIFSIDTNGNNYKDIYDFDGIHGSSSGSTLVHIGNKLYGMTVYGGLYKAGIIFSIDTDGTEYKDLYDFSGPDGVEPFGSLTLSENRFYGMTVQGGANNYGVIFSINIDGTGYKNLLDFNGLNGGEVFGTPTISGGTLYGLSQNYGKYGGGYGCLFSIDTNGTNYRDLFDFYGKYGFHPGDNIAVYGNLLLGMTEYDSVSYNNGFYQPGLIFSYNLYGAAGEDVLKGESEGVKVYPNPSNGMFTIEVNSQQPVTNNHIEIYNVLGQQVYQSIINADNKEIDLSRQPQGIYLYRIVRIITETEELIGEGKVVVQR